MSPIDLPDDDGPNISNAAVVKARRTATILALDLIDSVLDEGRDTVLVSQKQLAVRLGFSVENTAPTRASLRAAERLGWIRTVQRRAGASARLKIPTRLPHELGERAWEAGDTVDALAGRRPDIDDLAEVVTSAAHPAWGYALGGPTWLWLVADVADVNPISLGLSRRTVTAARRAWFSVLGEHDPDGTRPLEATLDAYAAASGTAQAAAQAEDRRRELAAERVAELEAVRARRDRARTGLDALLASHPVPKPTRSRKVRDGWFAELQAAVQGSGLPADLHDDVARALRGKLGRAGYGSDVAARVAAAVVGTGDEAVA